MASSSACREYADLYREILCRDCNKKSTVLFHIVGMKCGEEGCGSYNTSLEGGPLLRRVVNSDDNTVIYTPLTDQELSALSNIAINLPSDTNDNDSSESDSDDGWETTEEVSDHDDEVTGHNDHPDADSHH